MLATTAGVAAHADCLWAARLSAASTSGATGAARPPAWRAEPQRPAMTPAAWPRGPRDPPRPPRNRIVPSVRNGPAALGPRYPRPGEAARTCDACRGLIPPDFSDNLDILDV